MRYSKLFAALLVFAGLSQAAQNAAEIRAELERLSTVGSVLMIAAHPDDENTALLAYFAKGRHMRTAYLSMTRGEGGQNLIGSEQGEELGVIRTQELLAARRIDGAEQYFTRTIDFGFSRTAEETLEKWGRDAALADVVWTIRKFRPDVVVMVFSGTSRDGHGNHWSSGILGREAYSAAADPTKFPNQLKLVKVWQPRRLFQSARGGGPGGPGGPGAPPAGGQAARGGGRGARGGGQPPPQQAQPTQPQAPPQGAARGGAATPPPGSVTLDISDFDPLLGFNYGELSARSRSQHRSQGMGSGGGRNASSNSLTVEQGPPADKDPFDGIDTTWNRLPGGAAVAEKLAEAKRTFDFERPEKVVPALTEALARMKSIDDPWSDFKQQATANLIADAAGMWLDASSQTNRVVPNSTISVAVTAVNRSRLDIQLLGVTIVGADQAATTDTAAALAYNRPVTRTMSVRIPVNQPYTQPYWLAEPSNGTMYAPNNTKLAGDAEAGPWLNAHFRLKIGTQEVVVVRPVVNRVVEQVRGETVRPIEVVPGVGLQFTEPVLLFPDRAAKSVGVEVRATVANQEGEVKLELPAGWTAQPAKAAFKIAEAGESSTLNFTVQPPAQATTGTLKAVTSIGGREIRSSIRTIEYDHIPPQTLLPPAEAKLVRTDIKTLAKTVGYVMGAGDEVPAAIRQLGATVTMLDADALAHADLTKYDAIVTGVRAYNTRIDLRTNQPRLMDYVNKGGTLIVQYLRQERGIAFDKVGPYPFKYGTNNDARVTVEEAPMTLLKPDHRLLQAPNRITPADYSGWVQERGAYYAVEWDPRYEALWRSNDPGQPPLDGGTIYTKYGKGTFIFSPLAWFRQLPAGVPGAYRIFSNFLSSGKVK
jgi:LmbE family N-acetylglucosaminyl deacetylase